jgi:arylsulfatase A-like enzyme
MKSTALPTCIAIVMLLLASSPSLDAAPAERQDRPNILFIAIDDLRDLSSIQAGYKHPIMPRFDALTQRGIRFTNAQTPAPICNPARAAILSGMEPYTTGMYGFQPMWNQPIVQDNPTLPGYMKSNGYHVVGSGKIFHGANGQPFGIQPDEWDDYRPSKKRAVYPGHGSADLRPDTEVRIPGTPKYNYFGITDTPIEEISDTRHAADAVQWLTGDELKAPFFLAVGFMRPHLPLIARPEYFDRHPLEDVPDIPVLDDDLDDLPAMAHHIARTSWDRVYRRMEVQRKYTQAYLASASYIDDLIGRVIDALDASKYADNTIVVIWSDHGFHLGEKRHWEKFSLWDESARSPLLIIAPGMEQGATVATPVSLIDLYPTLVDLAGLEAPGHLDGRSLRTILADPEADPDRHAITTFGRDNYSLRQGPYRYIRYFDGTEELYDRSKDRLEWDNRADDPKLASVKARLESLLPKQSTPNAPGSVSKLYFGTDYPDLEK